MNRTDAGMLGADWRVVQSERSLQVLVLSRKFGEQIMIGNGIKVTVVEIRGDKVRLGIEAPKEVPVHRREVWESIQRQDEPDEPEQGEAA